MQSDKIVGKQIWLTFFHILVCIKYCSTFSKARKHFFSKQNKTLCLTRACPFHSHKIFEIFEMLFYFHQILKNPFSFQIKKTIFRLCRARASPFTPPPIQPFIQQWRRVRRSNEKQGEKEATLVSLFVFRQQREPSEQRKKLNDFTFEIMTSRQRVGADGSLGGHLS